MKRRISIAIISILLFFGYNTVSAQFYNGSQVTFGKNRVQYNDFFWTYYRFNSFDVYFYLNGKELAQHTADYVHRIIPQIETQLSTTLDTKLQFIVFNSLSDLKQSNLGLMENKQYNVGGITHIIGSKVFIYFNGDKNNFEQQIRAGIVRILTQKIIYGTSVTAQIKNNTIINLPNWFTDGLVSYYSTEWDSEMDNKMRQGMLNKNYKKINHLYGQDAVLIGHSFWRYIAQKFGKDKINNILFITRQMRSIEKGLYYVLSVPYDALMNDWQQWYEHQYFDFNADSFADYDNIPVKVKKNKDYYNLKVSPDGNNVIYVENKKGIKKLFLISDKNNGKKKRLLRQGIRSSDKIDTDYPIAQWHPNGNIITVIDEHKGQISFYFYDLREQKWTKQDLFGFQKILDFNYSPNGRNIIMSAVKKGQSDIYLYNIAANAAENITQDAFNDLNPQFVSNDIIVFSSNRPTDTLSFSDEYKQSYNGMSKNDLFVYNIKSRDKLLYRVEKSAYANETLPKALNENEFLFLSDKNGINNCYIANIQKVVASVDTAVHYRMFVSTKPVSNYNNSIIDYDIDLSDNQLLVKIIENNKPVFKQVPINKSPRILDQTDFTELSIKKHIAETQADTIKRDNFKRKRFVNVYANDVIIEDTSSSSIIRSGSNRGVPFFSSKETLYYEEYKKSEYNLSTPQARNYLVEYSINDLVSQLDFSKISTSYQPYLGYAGPVFQKQPTNANLIVGATDLLEDYRIILGTRLNTSLVNNEYIIGFGNYKKRLDKELFFRRSGFDMAYTNAYIRHHIYELHFILRYPFSEILALENTLSLQYDHPVSLAFEYFTANITPKPDLWGIEKLALIYDNTNELGLNLLDGTRFKIFSEYYQLAISEKEKTNMIVVGADFRNYLPIHKSFIWANRFSASTSFGRNRLLYYVGGVDNWIIPKFNTEFLTDYKYDYAFQALATNMRGFKQNIRSGNTFAIYSTELRFPVFKYLLNKPLKFEFLNNFQIVGFADVGSAWQGINPFDEDNTYFTRYIDNKPLTVSVKVQQDPLVAGYGFGLRTTVLGYFVRADWAWGVQDRKVIKKPMFYLSLSLDF
ncbi:MAG: hypothetical protein PHP31_09240 [Lentimicrobiaceae bacterium]|nr:hypothetical protein [Lentimicrobiaceae bacterium]